MQNNKSIKYSFIIWILLLINVMHLLFLISSVKYQLKSI